jgi:outer membrane biosynthesis protein TonB
VIISIGVSASGQPVFKVSQSSGFERLDDAARAAAERFFKIDFQNSDFSQDLRGAMQSPSGLKLKYTFRLKGEVKNGP